MRRLDALVLLYRTDPSYGHYTVLTKCGTPEYLQYMRERWGQETTLPVYCFVDSYGIMVDKELDFVPDRLKGILGEEFPHLKMMLKECPNVVEWNDTKLQGDTSNTCGRYASYRAATFYVPLETWVSSLRVKGKSPDNIITMLTTHPQSLNGALVEGGRRKRKSKRSGDYNQIVKININTDSRSPHALKRRERERKRDAKPKSDPPLMLPDARLDYISPYADAKQHYAAPKTAVRPTQASLFPAQIHTVQHNVDGSTTVNLQLAGAISQLANNLQRLHDGRNIYNAQREHDRAWLRQTDAIGGASGPVPAAEQTNTPIPARQAALDAMSQGSVQAPEEARPDVPPSVNAALDVAEMEGKTPAPGSSPPELPIHVTPVVTQHRTPDAVTTTMELPTIATRGESATFPRMGLSSPRNIELSHMGAFPVLMPDSYNASRTRRTPDTYNTVIPRDMGDWSGSLTRQSALNRSISQISGICPHEFLPYSPAALILSATPSDTDSPRTVEERRRVQRAYEEICPYQPFDPSVGSGLKKKRETRRRKSHKGV